MRFLSMSARTQNLLSIAGVLLIFLANYAL
jgi:hypothetical protein